MNSRAFSTRSQSRGPGAVKATAALYRSQSPHSSLPSWRVAYGSRSGEMREPFRLEMISPVNSGEPSSVAGSSRSEEHTSELQSPDHLVCRLLLEKKKQ